MLVHYLLLVPLGWWRRLQALVRSEAPVLTVFYDEECPLCNRTVIFIEHFDIRQAIAFRGLQSYARKYRALDHLPDSTLLKDLYALDIRGHLTAGIDTYIQILRKVGYTAPLGWILMLPGIHALAHRAYRKIADDRERQPCGQQCALVAIPEQEDERPFAGFYARHAHTDHQIAQRIAKALVFILVLQLNSTIHYGILYRWAGTRPSEPALALLDQASDSVINLSHAFFGISPLALYLHDHFDNYNEIVALAYRDDKGTETWLPFINQEGRLLTPNWGRIQSMWANVAITSHMSYDRLEKFTKKITAFYAADMGIDLKNAEFVIKARHVEVPVDWEYDLRHRNMTGTWRDIGTLQWDSLGTRLILDELPTSDRHRSADQSRGGGSEILH